LLEEEHGQTGFNYFSIMTWQELHDEVMGVLFPAGEPENLVVAHNRMVNNALWDLSKSVDCYFFGNINVYPSCSSYFNCGMTVLPAPRGRILKVYTLGQKKSAAAASTVTTPAAPAAGTVVGQAAFQQSMFGAPQAGLLVCNISVSGTYAIEVGSQFVIPAQYAIQNSPQYLVVAINYTDLNGVVQTINPATNAHLDGVEQSGSLTVSVLGGTAITATLTPFNTPYTDGGFTVDVTVTEVSAEATGSANSSPATPDPAWCSKVFYEQVDYCHIERYVKLSRECRQPSPIFAGALIYGLFGCGWRDKRRWPCPTDEGFDSLPPLPQGFHYPQSSTDAGGRSRGGVWALYHGRIYIAPWIESDETVVIEWNGIKDTWGDSDTVESDSKFRQAVMANVGVQHYTLYEENQQKLENLNSIYAAALRDLIHECREQNRKRACREAGGGGAASARGLGTTDIASTAFYNEAQSFTATCPVGQTGNQVTVTIAAGAVGSSLSVSDANATALQMATSQAQQQLNCSAAPVVYYNTPQTFTAQCSASAESGAPTPTGNPVTVTIPARQYQSNVSQAAADSAALAAATAQAQAQLVCTFYNAPQSYTASCPSGSTGSNVTKTIGAGAYTSTVSQAVADSLALTAAQNAAVAALVCATIPTFTIGNTVQVYSEFNCTTTCAANTFTAVVTAATQAAQQLALNQQALALAQSVMQEVFEQGGISAGATGFFGGVTLSCPLNQPSGLLNNRIPV
jgi:Family of unknown function (DUF5977)